MEDNSKAGGLRGRKCVFGVTAILRTPGCPEREVSCIHEDISSLFRASSMPVTVVGVGGGKEVGHMGNLPESGGRRGVRCGQSCSTVGAVLPKISRGQGAFACDLR
jgi:hypothetical protein